MRRPDLRTLKDRRVLITGAASGIGRALANAVAAQGATVFMTDRAAVALKAAANDVAAAGGTVGGAEPVDITDFDAVTELGRTFGSGGPMDVVMNVAGIAAWGTVDRLEHRQWRAMVEVNLMGPIHVIETFVPPMIAAGRGGHLVNVSSAAGLLGLPWHAAYSASKFGLRGVSEVLRFDLREHGIGVSLVVPGGVDTPLTDSVEIAGVDKSGRAFTRMQAHFRKRAVTPEQAAAAILRGVRRNQYLVYTSPDIRALHAVQRICPPAYTAAMRGANLAMRRALPATRPATAPR